MKFSFLCSQICIHWLKQCFWNYLDWGDVCHYVCLCIILGIDYQVYLCVSILKHIQKDITEHMQTQDLIIYLKVRLGGGGEGGVTTSVCVSSSALTTRCISVCQYSNTYRRTSRNTCRHRISSFISR